VLFIDARKLGTLVDRMGGELNNAELAQISNTYHAWRGRWFTNCTLVVIDTFFLRVIAIVISFVAILALTIQLCTIGN